MTKIHHLASSTATQSSNWKAFPRILHTDFRKSGPDSEACVGRPSCRIWLEEHSGFSSRFHSMLHSAIHRTRPLSPSITTFGGEQLIGEYPPAVGAWRNVAASPASQTIRTPARKENLNQFYGSLFGAGTVPIDDVWHFGYTAHSPSYALSANATAQRRRSADQQFAAGRS